MVYTGIRMALQKEDMHIDVESNRAVGLLRRVFPITDGYREEEASLPGIAASKAIPDVVSEMAD